jgi:hypothetical protein
MYGFPLQQAQAVARRCLKNLRQQDTFQIIKFAGYPDQFAPKAVPATSANIQAGIDYVAKMRGGGGTEFIPALKLALLSKKSPGRSRIVLFVTDGYIGYEREVLRFLRKNAKGINVFALGIGSSVNRYLIDGMARIGVGSPFYLLNTEKASSVVERIFATISKPALTSIDIDWGGLDVEELTPAAIPDLFGEKPVFVVGRFDRAGSGTVTVKGRLAGKPFRQQLRVTLPKAATGSNSAVAYLWARRQIADWMDIYATEPDRTKEMEKSVTKVALRYNLMSKFTSFVAVDQTVRNQGGQQTTVPVPVPLPDGVSPYAAPKGAYVGGALTRGRHSMRYRRSKRAYGYAAPVTAAPMPAAEAAAPRPKPRPTKRPAPPLTDPRDADDSKADRPAHAASLRVSLGADLKVSGSANPARIQARLHQLLRRLPGQLASLKAGTRGTVKLRLVLDASGRVTRVAFVSGSLMLPSIKAELGRLVKGWRFGVLPEPTTVVFTLRVS